MHIIATISFVLLVGFDQVVKYFCFTYLKPIGSITVVEGILNFTYVENRGAAFGIMQGARWFFVVFTLLLVAFMIFYYRKLSATTSHKFMKVALVLVISGAIGNWIDRLFLGYVIDFLHVKFIEFPVFNMADIYVVCGTILFSILFLFFDKEVCEEISSENPLDFESKDETPIDTIQTEEDNEI